MKKFLLLPFLLLLLLAPAASAGERAAPSWGLDRLDDEAATDGFFRSLYTGSGTDIYMLDTGIATHSELAGRVQDGWSASGGTGKTDCNGQGTAAAVLAAGTTYGVAPGATLYPVRALDCNAEGTATNVANGMQWVATHHTSRPAVLVVGAAIPLSEAVDNMVTTLASEGVLVVAATGDVFADACTRSPAAASGALAVGAVDSSLQRAIFSGFGTCLDVWAPGKDLLVAEEGSPLPVARSGTALAAAQAGGLAALFLERRPAASAASVRSGILARARSAAGDVISSPDLLLFAADLAYKPGASRFWEPTLLAPPAYSETSSATWSLADGYYSDSSVNSTWIRGSVQGSSYTTELVCQLRTQGGAVLLSQTLDSEIEPSACTLAFGILEDGVYRFVVRKDLVGPSRIEGRERSVRFELDRQGPQASWGTVPEFWNENILELPLQVYDRQAIDGIAAADFLQEGTADCLLTPVTYSLPAGGGEFRVRALCSSEGTLRAALRAASFYSGERPGPAATVRAPTVQIDWTAPQTTILSGPASETTSAQSTFRFQSSETTGGLQCRIGADAWQSCASDWTSPSLSPGSYSLDVRAVDGAGNADSSPASWRWSVLAPPPSTDPPTNDDWADAKEITAPSIQKGNNQYATRETDEPEHGRASVWYRFVAPSGGRLNLSTQKSAFDTNLALYRGSSFGSLQRITSNDDWGTELWSNVNARVEGGQTYYIALASARAGRGAFTLSTSLSPLGQSGTSSFLKAVKRFPKKRMARLAIGVDGYEQGQSIQVQCAQTSSTKQSPTWETCSFRPLFRNLRRGRSYMLWSRLVVDGLPERRPTTIRIRL